MLALILIAMAQAKAIATFTTDVRWGEAHSVSWSFSVPQKNWQSPALTEVTAQCESPHTFSPVWTNARTLKVDIAPELKPNESCQFTLPKEVGAQHNEFRAPRARILDELGRFAYGLNEDDPILIPVDHAIDPQRLAAHAYLEVEGLEEKVELDVITGDVAEVLSKQHYHDADKSLYWFKPRRVLASNKKIILHVSEDQTYAFSKEGKTREPFSATVNCERAKPNDPCSPFGSVTVSFNNSVAPELLNKARLVMQGKEYPPEKIAEETTYINFKVSLAAEAGLEVRLPAGLRDIDGRGLSNQKNFPVKMKVGEYPPLAKLPGAFGILEGRESPVLPITVRNTERPLKVQLNQARWTSMSAANLLKWLDATNKRQYQSWDPDLRASSVFAGTRVPLVTRELPPKLSKKELEIIGLPLTGNGLHVVEIVSPKLGESLLGAGQNFYISSLTLVTNMAIHWKQGGTGALAWVTSLDKGEPVAGANVTVHDCMGKELAHGTTTKEGVANFPTLAFPRSCSNKDFNYFSDAVVTAQTKDDFSFVLGNWGEGLEPWRFGVSSSWREDFLEYHTTFDRPIYLPGQAVSGLILARDFIDKGLALPKAQLKTLLQFTHEDSGKKWETSVKWNELKGAPFTFKLPAEAPLGVYGLYLYEKNAKGEAINRKSVGSFEVEAFKVPLMGLELGWKDDKDFFSFQSPSSIVGNLRYLSGPPAVGLKLKLRGEMTAGYGKVFPEHTGISFANGHYSMLDLSEPTEKIETIEFKTGKGGALSTALPHLAKASYLRNMALELEYMDPSGMLQSRPLYGTVSPSEALVGIVPMEKLDLKSAAKLKLMVVDVEGKPLKEAPVRLELLTRKWVSVRKKILGGYYSYDSSYQTKPLAEICEGKTDGKGFFTCSYQFKSAESYILQAYTKDKEGREGQSYVEVYVNDDASRWEPTEASDRADLVANKKEYSVGEEASLDFKVPFPESTVLFTRERRGILTYQLLHLDRAHPAIRFKVTDYDAPNQFVSAMAVRGRDQSAAPSGTIDLGKPAFRMGLTEIRVKKPETSLKLDVKVSPAVTLVRSNVKVKVKVAREIAAALPKTKLAVAVVDAGLFSLRAPQSFDLRNAFVQEFVHKVKTATSNGQIIGRRHFGLKSKPTGGDGGKMPARELFDSLLYWNPAVELNAQGEAEITVKANDSLTEFRVMALAYSESLFGLGEASFQVTQDLLTFASLSPTLRVGDQTASNFTLQNTTSRELDLQLDYVQGFGVNRKELKKTALKANEAEVVSFSNPVLDAPGVLTHDLSIKEKGKNIDRLKTEQRVLPLKVPMVTASDFVEVSKTLDIPAPARTGLESHIQVYFSGSVLGTQSSLQDWMKAYPYNCLEQQTARLVILGDKTLRAKYLKELPLYQDGDGLLRYYPSETSSGFAPLTSHVLELNHWAKLGISKDVVSKAEKALVRVHRGEIGLYSWADKSWSEQVKLHALATLFLIDSAEAKPEWASLVRFEEGKETLSSLIDKWIILTKTNRLPERDLVLTDLARRFEVSSAKLELKERPEDRNFWFLTTPAAQFARFLLLAKQIGVSDSLSALYKGQEAKWLRGFSLLKANGHYGETISNSYASLVHVAYPSPPPTGKSMVNKLAYTWPGDGDAIKVTGEEMFAPLKLTHLGQGVPYADLQYFSYLDGTRSHERGFALSHEMKLLEGKSPKVGERIQLTYTVQARQNSSQVAMRIPLPSGTSTLQLETEGELLYQERDFHEVRLYFNQLSTTPVKIVLTVRPNQAGKFSFPGATVEEMYAAQVFGKEKDAEIVIE